MISVSVAQDVAEANNWKQVIIFGWDGQETSIITWGLTATDSAQAAEGSNQITRHWDWPNYPVISSEIQAMHDTISSLKQQLALLGEQVDDGRRR